MQKDSQFEIKEKKYLNEIKKLNKELISKTKMLKVLERKILIRKKQQTLDNCFKELLKKDYPNIYKKIVEKMTKGEQTYASKI